jgi:Tol biopolymer transport system component
MASIQGIYVALFGRPADPEGLAYWNGVTNEGADLSGLIGTLTGTPEYLDRFESQTPSEIVSLIYLALFGRAPDPEGLAFFTAALDSGAQTIETIAINIFDGAQNDDQDTVTAKMEAADAFTPSLDTPEEIAAQNLIADAQETNGYENIFVYRAGALTNITAPANGSSSGPGVSADGSTIVFTSEATDLTASADENGVRDIFVSKNGTLTNITAHGNGLSGGAKISADGSTIVFYSEATNLVAGQDDTNGKADIFVYRDGVITNLTLNADGDSDHVTVSADGSTIAFKTAATNLTGAVDDNGVDDIIIYRDGVFTNITAHGDRASEAPILSADGNTILFNSRATNLVDGTNSDFDIYIYRDSTLTNLRLHGDGFTSSARLSPDGNKILFVSSATNLVPGVADTNRIADLFLYEML